MCLFSTLDPMQEHFCILFSFCLHSYWLFCLFLLPVTFFFLLFVWLTIQNFFTKWSHPIHTALNKGFSADSKQFCKRIIFTLFNPPLHLDILPSLQNCRSVPTIAPLPCSVSLSLYTADFTHVLVMSAEWVAGVLVKFNVCIGLC